MIKKFAKRFIDFIYGQSTLEERLFCMTLCVGTIMTIVSAIVTLSENLSGWSVLSTLICSLVMVALIIVAYVLKKPRYCPVILVYLLTFILIPMNFFACGGIDSGMPLYLLAALFLIIPILHGKQRIIAFAITLLVDSYMILLSYYMYDETRTISFIDKDILVKLDLKAQVHDVVFSLLIVGVFMYLVTSMMMTAYQKEREHSAKLLNQLRDISLKDALTGLYNRYELYNRLESMDIKGPYYIAMFDIDHFKNVNDTYGHVFGDQVLIKVALEFSKALDDEEEMAARYGGEEFIIIMKEKDGTTPQERIEKIRDNVRSLSWDIKPDPVTISAGLVKCSDYDNITAMMSEVDNLLYASKEGGRDKLTVGF